MLVFLFLRRKVYTLRKDFGELRERKGFGEGESIPGAAEVLLADVLLRPRMSLVHQSYAARERRALPQGVSPSTFSALFAHACALLCVILASGVLVGMAYQQPCLIRGCSSEANQSTAAMLTCSEEC